MANKSYSAEECDQIVKLKLELAEKEKQIQALNQSSTQNQPSTSSAAQNYKLEFIPGSRKPDEDRQKSFQRRLTEVNDIRQFRATFKAIKHETTNELSFLELGQFDVPTEINFTGKPPNDMRPCRWYQIGKCFSPLTLHFEHKSIKTEDKIKTHLCQLCYEIYGRCEGHPGFECHILQFLDQHNEKLHIDTGSVSFGSDEPSNKKTKN